MASAVWLGSSKPLKKNRAVFERPQPASPAYGQRLRLLARSDYDEDELKASHSSPYFTFTGAENTSGNESPWSPPRHANVSDRTEAASNSPALGFRPVPVTLAPPSPLLSPLPGFRVVEPLDAGLSAVSLLGDELPRSSSSAGLGIGKDWRQMQVSDEPHPLLAHRIRIALRCYTQYISSLAQEATFTNWVNERLKGKQTNYTGPRIQDLR